MMANIKAAYQELLKANTRYIEQELLDKFPEDKRGVKLFLNKMADDVVTRRDLREYTGEMSRRR
jgi:hypothetical protein